MITVVPDTNALFEGQWINSLAGRKLLEEAEGDLCRLVLPAVVAEELERQYIDKIEEASAKARSGLQRIRKDIDMDAIDAAFEAHIARVKSDRETLFARNGITLVDTPATISRSLVRRDLERRRPFLETEQDKKKKSYGFRDAVLWETILAIVQDDNSTGDLYFVTKDNGFIDKNAAGPALHPHLLDDLDALNIARSRVIVVDSLTNVVEMIRVAVAEAGAKEAEAAAAVPLASELSLQTAASARARATDTARHAALVRVATHAVEALVGEEITERMVSGGDYKSPEFVLFDIPPALESAEIVAIDLESDFTFESGNGDIVVGRADALLSIQGFTWKADYFSEEDNELIITGDLNDHYFETATSVRVKAIVYIDTEFNPDGLQIEHVRLRENI